MRRNRTAYSIRNMMTGIFGQFFTLLLQFVSRTLFINTIGLGYLGIQGLFHNVLTLLSISELGIGTAIVYSLYKPLVDNDIPKIQATMRFLRNAYRIVGCAVAVIGLALMPALPYLMKGTTDLVNVNLIYLLYVAQSATSYFFFAYKASILQADQKKYVVNVVNYAVTAGNVILQIVLLAGASRFGVPGAVAFIGYVVLEIAAGWIKNIVAAVKVNKLYPYLAKPTAEVLPQAEKKQVFKNIYGLTLYKISGTVLNSTDNIVISAFIGTVWVGLYSNYLMITNAIVTLVNNFFSAFTASIGNLFASESKEKSEFIFRCLNFLNFWVYGFCAISLWILLNPFITLCWVGEDKTFTQWVVLTIVMNFLTSGLQSAVISYKDACGLFWQGRYRPLASAVINVVVSIILAKQIGIAGVFLGTIISRFLTTWWFDPWMIHHYAFEKKATGYYLRYWRSFFIVVLTGLLVTYLVKPFSEPTILHFVIRCGVCAVVPNLIFFLLFFRSEEFKYVKQTALGYVKPLLSKLKGTK